MDAAKRPWNAVEKLHARPNMIYSHRGSRFIATSFLELWKLTKTTSTYTIAYPRIWPTNWRSGRTNELRSGQFIRCIVRDTGSTKYREIILQRIELLINWLPAEQRVQSVFLKIWVGSRDTYAAVKWWWRSRNRKRVFLRVKGYIWLGLCKGEFEVSFQFAVHVLQ